MSPGMVPREWKHYEALINSNKHSPSMRKCWPIKQLASATSTRRTLTIISSVLSASSGQPTAPWKQAKESWVSNSRWCRLQRHCCAPCRGSGPMVKTNHSECTKTSKNSAIPLCVGNANYIRAFPVFVADFATTFAVPTSFSKLDSVKKIDCCRNSTVHQISDSITRSDAPDFQSACLDSPWPCQGPVTSVVIGSLSQTAKVAKTAETTRNNKQK